MALDPMALLAEARPKPSPEAQPFTPQPGAMRRARASVIEDHTGQQRDSRELETHPGTASYRDKIPNPPCARCQMDHNPIYQAQGKYDHEYVHPASLQDDALTVIPMGPSASTPPPAPAQVAATTQRVTVLPARGGDDFIVGIEENPPDWDLADSWRMTADEVLKFLPILRKLNVKIRDNTGGELKSLELERSGH